MQKMIRASAYAIATDGTFEYFFAHHHATARIAPSGIDDSPHYKQARPRHISVAVDVLETGVAMKPIFLR